MSIEFYPYNAPIVLTDAIYATFGGYTGTSTSAQRNVAYWLAEELVSEYLGTFLLPTQVTGTYYYPQFMLKLPLHHKFIQSIDAINIKSPTGKCSCELRDIEGCAYIMDEMNAYLLITEKHLNYCAPCGMNGWHWCTPFLVDITYTSGLPSGTSFQPSILMALTLLAGESLMEITDPTALPGGLGNPGIQAWSNLSYSETLAKLYNTVFGSSPVANYIVRLLASVHPKPALKLGW